MTLDDFIELLYKMGIRFCYHCGRAFTEGYANDDHEFCSEDCYAAVYTEEYFIRKYGEYKTLDDVAYWCSIDTDDRIADSMNRVYLREESMGKKMTLEEFMEEAKKGGYIVKESLDELLNEMGVRWCNHCGRAFVSGYYADMNYYCSDKCKDEAIDPEEWKRLTDPDSDDYCDEYYWTEWEAPQEVADAYNNVFFKEEK